MRNWGLPSSGMWLCITGKLVPDIPKRPSKLSCKGRSFEERYFDSRRSLGCLEKSAAHYPVTRRHIPEERRMHTNSEMRTCFRIHTIIESCSARFLIIFQFIAWRNLRAHSLCLTVKQSLVRNVTTCKKMGPGLCHNKPSDVWLLVSFHKDLCFLQYDV
jgi:hypothetical protein